MRFYDRLSIDGTNKTASGYLTVSAKVAKAGNVQTYLGSEVGKPEVATVRVYRPRDEVLNARPTFAHKPVTLGHPGVPVTADNWKEVARGWTGDEVAAEGDIIRVPMLLADAEAIRAVEGGTRQLSMGYDCTLDWTPGTSPSGEAYDAIQRGIRGNHVAIVDAARGGPELTIGDAAVTQQQQGSTPMHAIDQAMVDEEAKKPLYDNFRGLSARNGTPLDKYYAAQNLMRGSPEGQRALAAHDHMVDTLVGRVAPPQATNDNAPADPVTAKDGRPFGQLSDAEKARERMQRDMADAWRH